MLNCRLNKKEKRILDYLLVHKMQFCTSCAIAKAVAFSERTVREYIKGLANIQAELGIVIQAKQGHGYRLIILDEKQFFYSFNRHSTHQSQKIESPKDRQAYILKKLLFEQDYLLFEELENQLFVSHSTLSVDFKEITELISPYHLSIKSKPNKGVAIIGREKDLRFFIMDYFFAQDFGNTITRYIGHSIFSDEMNFEEVTHIVLSECHKAELQLSDVVVQNLVLHILLAIKRFKQGFTITDTTHKQLNSYRLELRVAERILKRIEVEYGITIAQQEIEYIALHFISKGRYSIDDEQPDLFLQPDIFREFEQIIYHIETALQYDIYHDVLMRHSLQKHIQLLLIRLENGIRLENPLCKDIIEHYPEVFATVKKYFSGFNLFKTHTISEDEYSYLTLHLLAAIERNKTMQKLRVVVICTTGYGSAQMIRNRLEGEFSEHLIIQKVISYYELNEQALEKADFIVSSIDLSNILFKIPVIHTSIFLKPDECKQIHQLISQLKSHSKAVAIVADEIVHQDRHQLVQNFFSADCFYIYPKTTSKEMIIDDLLQKMAINESEKYIRRMKAQMAQREFLGSVVFSEHIVVPHPAKPIGNMAKIGVAIMPYGVGWSQDYPNIQLMFILSPAHYGNTDFKYATQAIIRLIEDRPLQQQLIACQSYDEFVAIFSKII